MKYINLYKNLGLDNNVDKIFNFFIATLKKSIFTWDYFVDWEKINKNIGDIEKELNILNYLIGKNNIEEEFLSIIEEYPEVKKVLPILLAIRNKKLKQMKILTNLKTLECEDIYFLFCENLPKNYNKHLLIFFRESGLKEIFKDKKIKNLVDYCYGLEVGLDTNARKNRTGNLMENIVHSYLNKFCPKFSLKFLYQVKVDVINQKWYTNINIKGYDRVFDFAILNKNKDEITIIETNYYSGGGSKLKSTAGEYLELNNILLSKNINFIWITDGTGWKTAKLPLYDTFQNNDYIFNLELINNGVLQEVIL